jgi:hypothetical protein
VEQSPTSSHPIIQVVHSNIPPEKQVIFVETIPQNNCGGTAPVSNELERFRTIVHTIELGGGVAVNEKGEAGIPGVGNVQVGAEVAATYGYSYGQQDTISRKLTVSAKEGSWVNHKIQQVEYWQPGEVIILIADKEVGRYHYQFRTDFGIEFVETTPLSCPISVATTATAVPPTSSISSESPTNTPESPTTVTVTATKPPSAQILPSSNNISNFRPQQESDSRVKITVDCTYNGEHGDKVNLGIYVLRNGEQLPWFGWDVMIISAGSGTVTTRINYGYDNPPATTTTDQIVVTLYANNDPAFYSQTFDYPMTWRIAR